MEKLILYHGDSNQIIIPQQDIDDDIHDYGKGFYLTENIDLAKEWSVCKPESTNGWVHKYELDITELKILDL